MLKEPVSAKDHVQGDPNALLVLVEYGDYQCPACGMAYPIVKQVQQQFGTQLCFVFRNFPLSDIHPYAKAAAEIAEGANLLGRFWDMHDWLYANQQSWVPMGEEGLREAVRALGLDTTKLEDALRKHDVDERIQHDFMTGVRSGVNGTPSFYINGRMFQGDFGDLGTALSRQL